MVLGLIKIHFSGYFKLPFPLKKKLLMKLQTPKVYITVTA